MGVKKKILQILWESAIWLETCKDTGFGLTFAPRFEFLCNVTEIIDPNVDPQVI